MLVGIIIRINVGVICVIEQSHLQRVKDAVFGAKSMGRIRHTYNIYTIYTIIMICRYVHYQFIHIHHIICKESIGNILIYI